MTESFPPLLIFLETQKQLDTFLDNHSLRWVSKVIAVFPDVYELAAQSGLNVTPLDDFGSIRTLTSYSNSVIKRIEEMTEIFDSCWEKVSQGIPAAQCISFRCFFHTLKGYFDALIIRGLPVVSAFDLLRPRKHFFFPTAYEVNGFSLLDKPITGLTNLLAMHVAAKRKIEILSADRQNVGSFEQYCRYPVPMPSAISAGLARKILISVENDPAYSLPRHHRNTLFIYDAPDSVTDSLIVTWSKSGNSVVSIVPPQGEYGLPTQVLYQCCLSLANKAADHFFADSRISQLLKLENLDVSDILMPYINAFLRIKIPSLLALAHCALSYYRGFSHAVMLSGGMANEAFVLTRAARLAGAITVNQHKGGYLGYCLSPMHERYDLGEADFYITNGRESAKNLVTPCEECSWPVGYRRATPVAVGAAWVWNIHAARRVPRDRKEVRICYLLEGKIGDNSYLGKIMRPSFTQCATERAVIDIFKDHPEIQLYVKPYPSDRFSLEPDPVLDKLRNTPQPNIRLLEHCSIASIAHLFDVFILDCPGTALTELAATEATVVLYADRDVYTFHENAKQILSECSYLYTELEPFLACLKRFCTAPRLFPPKSMEPFLWQFCLTSQVRSPDEILCKFLEHIV